MSAPTAESLQPAGSGAIRNSTPADSGSTFQVWIAKDPKDRIALGTIQPDGAGNATVVLPVPASANGYRRVWVTNEPSDGNPKWTTDWIVKAS